MARWVHLHLIAGRSLHLLAGHSRPYAVGATADEHAVNRQRTPLTRRRISCSHLVRAQDLEVRITGVRVVTDRWLIEAALRWRGAAPEDTGAGHMAIGLSLRITAVGPPWWRMATSQSSRTSQRRAPWTSTSVRHIATYPEKMFFLPVRSCGRHWAPCLQISRPCHRMCAIIRFHTVSRKVPAPRSSTLRDRGGPELQSGSSKANSSRCT